MAYDGGALSAPIATQHTRFPFFVEKSCGIFWERFIPTLVGRDKSYARTGKKCLFTEISGNGTCNDPRVTGARNGHFLVFPASRCLPLRGTGPSPSVL